MSADQPVAAAAAGRGPARSGGRIRYYGRARLAASLVARGLFASAARGSRAAARPGPAIYCFNHLSWSDPFVLMAVLPLRPRLSFFGPKEEDMRGRRTEPHHALDGYDDPVQAGEERPARGDAPGLGRHRQPAAWSRSPARAGSIRAKPELLPLSEGAAYFAIRSGVPLVPIAINGTSWLRFGGRVRVQVGEPIVVERPAEP